MAFQLVDYDVLKGKIKESIDTLRSDYAKKSKKVPSHREIHVQFLNEVVAVLDRPSDTVPSDKDEKAYILNMATYLVWFKISQERNGATSSFGASLKTSLEINKENSPTDQDLHVGYPKLEKFLRLQSYVKGATENGYLAKRSFLIPGYKVEADIIFLMEKRHAMAKALMEKRHAMAKALVHEKFKEAEVTAQKAAASATKPTKSLGTGAVSAVSAVFGIFSSAAGDAAGKKSTATTTATAPVATAKPASTPADSTDDKPAAPGLD